MSGWINELPTLWVLLLFGLAGVIIVTAGSRFTGIVDHLADRTRLGEAISGAVFLGATTSLPDLVVSTSTAAAGHPEMAISNAVGGIAVQTAFLAIADITYRRANLEHAAASLGNMLEATLLIVLLSIPLMVMAAPAVTLWSVHPASAAMVISYLWGLRWATQQRGSTAWKPKQTSETFPDAPDDDADRRPSARLWTAFAFGAFAVAAAGYLVAQTGLALAERTGLSESAVGAVFTGIITSSGELVTSIAAVRRGALTLAVSGIIGGNTFDCLLIPVSDFVYRDGSIYHAVGNQSAFLIASTILMTGILLTGLLSRQKHGFANIGFEGVLVLAVYCGTVALLVLS